MSLRAIAEIDLNSIEKNINLIRNKIGKDVKILLPVKANAYGHGIIEVSKFVEKNMLVDMLGVASLDEGIELRKAGINLPILIFGLILPDKNLINLIFDYDLSQTFADTALVEKISQVGRKRKKNACLHLKIDTGMGRIGCRPEKAVEIIRQVSSLKYINLEGIYSHFPIADDTDSEYTAKQINKFKQIINELQSEGIDIPIKHISNSAGIIHYPESFFSMVRPGIMVYGYLPSSTMKSSVTLEPSMTLRSYIIFIKSAAGGTPLSYGLTYTTNSKSNIATIPIGYGDGYSRFLSNKGKVIIRNKIYPVVGRVSMDQILVNLGNDEYPPGEEVILFGKKTITVDTVADWIDTIAYEVTCGISKRVPRVYINQDASLMDSL